MILEIIILSFESRHKAEGQNAVPHTKSEEKTLSKVWFFFLKSLKMVLAYVYFLFVNNVH